LANGRGWKIIRRGWQKAEAGKYLGEACPGQRLRRGARRLKKGERLEYNQERLAQG
jgi:hypothetical protein